MNNHVHPIFADILKTFAPIPCPLPDQRKPGPHSPPPVLEFARAQPARIKPTDYDALTTQAECRELTIRTALNDSDIANALSLLFERGDLDSRLSERIEEVAMEFAEKRLNGGAL
jgi:hypothetical protein